MTERLTDNERVIRELWRLGYSQRDTATFLGVTRTTVQDAWRNIRRKGHAPDQEPNP